MVTDEILNEICDNVENSLENYVLKHKDKLFENGKIIEGGMEDHIKNQYESRLSRMLLTEGSNIELLKNKKIHF